MRWASGTTQSRRPVTVGISAWGGEVHGHEEHVEQRLITGFVGSQLAHGSRQPVQDVGQVTQVGFQAVAERDSVKAMRI